MKLGILYFSGTGNTKWVVEQFAKGLHYDSIEMHSIEESIDYASSMANVDDIMVAYPIIGGNIPIIMREFLHRHESIFWGKGLITVVSEAGFSGDGGALAYRFLGSDKVTYKASYHIIMPTNVSFGKVFAIKNGSALNRRLARSSHKIKSITNDMNVGHYKRVGSTKLSYILGYHMQRKYFDRIEDGLRKKFSCNNTKCVQCKKCISFCPMDNITMENGRIIGLDKCTLCYRCLHACPTNAISLIRHESVQYKGVTHAVR